MITHHLFARRPHCQAWLLLISSLLVLSLPLIPPRSPDRIVRHEHSMAEVPASVQALLSARLGADDRSYQIAGAARAYYAHNRAQGFAATIDARGMMVQIDAASWGLMLWGWGRAGAVLRQAGQATTHVTRNRIEVRQSGITTWYMNGPVGLEQGWTVEAPLPRQRGTPLTLILRQSGTLRAYGSGTALNVSDSQGRISMHYSGVRAWDARGHALRAWMELADSLVELHVDDGMATYPLHIDPWVQSAKLTATNGMMDDRFGASVAISSDASTIVAGAPFAAAGAVNRGAALVYLRPSTLWVTATQTAELTASDSTDPDYLGTSVAVSSDTS